MGFEETFTKDHFIEVLKALHRDQTGLAEALNKVKATALGWSWALESRGMYAWDDNEYQKEFGNCLEAILDQIESALTKTSQAHQVCCHKYRHLNFDDRTAVQLKLQFEEEQYFQFVEERIKECLMESSYAD